MKLSFYDYCMTHSRNDLLLQWHPTKNGTRTPETVTFASHQKVWWICEQGHEWEGSIYIRTSRISRCPYCTGRRIIPGKNDFASQRPELVAQWHPTKNNGKRPEEVFVSSHERIWWICEFGHEWNASVRSRSAGTGCPVCKRRLLLRGENDLATTHPTLAREWHPTKNGKQKPSDVLAGTEPDRFLEDVKR